MSLSAGNLKTDDVWVEPTPTKVTHSPSSVSDFSHFLGVCHFGARYFLVAIQSGSDVRNSEAFREKKAKLTGRKSVAPAGRSGRIDSCFVFFLFA